MGKAIDAHKKSIGELLGRYEVRPVVLPKFQRSFSWETSQISTFWNDLNYFRRSYLKDPVVASYFLGPIVILDSKNEIILLDGQQRLATATILLSAVRNLSRTIDNGAFHKGDDLARDIQRELIEKESEPISYSLRLNMLDEPFFQECIQKDPPSEPKIKLRSHKLIKNAYNYFFTELKSLLSSNPEISIKNLKQIHDALIKGMTLVSIIVQDEEDAFGIFETLNDRGLRLSVPDLLINLLMKRCGKEHERDVIRQKWNTIISTLGKRDISRFLRHMWISQYGDIKARGLYSEIKSVIEKKDIVSLQFSEQCADECEDYLSILDINGSFPKTSLSNLEGLTKYLRVYNALPLLLAGYRCLSKGDFDKLVHLITSLYIRHTLICNQNPNDLEAVLYEASREIRGKHSTNTPSRNIFSAIKQLLQRLNPTDSSVEENAKELVLERQEALWFMTQIANAMQSKTKEIGMDDSNLEHIFPQNAGNEWSQRKLLEPYIWHIGNLTILGTKLNQKAKNKYFKNKCTDNYSKSEIEMTKQLIKIPKWEIDEIKARATVLAKTIITIWK
jgi:uncharacterized protein with ParB-like and HNH nuclease domain